eukprot:1352106-Rhodomonas_salina.3
MQGAYNRERQECDFRVLLVLDYEQGTTGGRRTGGHLTRQKNTRRASRSVNVQEKKVLQREEKGSIKKHECDKRAESDL